MTDDSPRKRRLREASAFAEERPPAEGAPTIAAADAALFGQLRAREGQRPVTRLLALADIQPDAQQPRRSLPRKLRAALFQGASPGELLARWAETAAPQREWQSTLAIGEADYEEQVCEQLQDAAFRDLLALAISIRRDGLQHPITVSRSESGHFLIESGERRWLAFHLLYENDERERWARIPARIHPAHDLWRQATENSAREDLNAIARARQFALLLMDVWRESGEQEQRFRPLAEFRHEQEFYAQAAALRVPYGAGGRILNAMGLRHRNAFRRCRLLLKLPRASWERGDEEDWSEDRLLRLARSAPANADKQAAPLPEAADPWPRQFARWQKQLAPAQLRKLPAARRRQLREWLRGLLAALGE